MIHYYFRILSRKISVTLCTYLSPIQIHQAISRKIDSLKAIVNSESFEKVINLHLENGLRPFKLGS